jgi:hypothetical protein
MKTLLLILTFVFSLSMTYASEEFKVKKHNYKAKRKVVWREHKHQKKSVVRKFKPNEQMFLGEGQINGLHRFSKW